MNEKQLERFENQPQKVKVGWKLHENGKCEKLDSRRYWHRIDFFDECKRFINHSVGKHFDKAFHEFCQKYPKFVCGINTRDHFMWYFEVRDRYAVFYLDKQKRIQKYKLDPKPKKYVDFVEDDVDELEYMIEINRAVIDEMSFRLFFLNRIPRYYYDLLYKDRNRFISCAQYNKIMHHFHMDTYMLRSFIKEECEKNRYLFHLLWIEMSNELRESGGIFRKVMITPTKRFYKGDKEFQRYYAELKDSTNKVQRERKKRIKEQHENLLHDITEKRKLQEREKNLIDRDRLGFDNESFKGDFYHGQKRKKKKNKN